MAHKFLLFLSILAIFSGCGNRSVFEPGKLLYQPRYAEGFAIHEAGEHSTLVRVKDPWQGAEGVDQWVFISRGGESAPKGFTGVIVSDSPEKIICMSASYIAFLEQLGEGDRIVGVSGLDFVTSRQIRERGVAADIVDVGYETNLNFELIATLKPDLILMYGVSDDGRQVTGKYREMDLPYMFIAEYLESLPLGKAEWIVALAEICGKRQDGIEEFEKIEKSYLGFRNIVAGFTERPVVMLNTPYRDTWYVPGNNSYMVRMLYDAGGEYACSEVDSRESRPIDIEQAYVAMQRSDYWLNTNHYLTLGELLADNPRFGETPAVRNGRVFNNNARTSPQGGSDFWESGVVRPDVVLHDLVKILHPQAFTDSVYHYYKRLK